MGIFCGCLIFAEFCGSIEIAEIKNRKISVRETFLNSIGHSDLLENIS